LCWQHSWLGPRQQAARKGNGATSPLHHGLATAATEALRCGGTPTLNTQQSSAKLTHQRVSYAFTVARLVSMPVIFCLLSSTSILVFYLFFTGISEQHA